MGTGRAGERHEEHGRHEERGRHEARGPHEAHVPRTHRAPRKGAERPSDGDRRDARARFTLAVLLSAVAALVAWMWFAIVVEDTWGDECAARAAGQSGVTFLIAFGVVPLVLVTVGVVAASIGFAPGGRGGKVWRGLVAAMVITVAGVLLAWWATDGMLVAHLALGSGCLA